MSKKKAILKRVAKDWIVVDCKHRIVGKVKVRHGVYSFKTHKDAWMDHHTMYYVNLLIWQLRRHHCNGVEPHEVTGFEPGLHIFIKAHAKEWE